MRKKVAKFYHLKQRLIHETKLYFLYASFLFILLSVFSFYERLLLDIHGFHMIRMLYCLMESLILAKVILIGEVFELGEKFKQKPLIIPVLYKTLVFSLLLLIFNVAEHHIVHFFGAHTLMSTPPHLVQNKLNILLAKSFILIVIFAQFFTVLELSRSLGRNVLFNLFFKRK